MKRLYALDWKIGDDIENKKEVKAIIENIEERVVEICSKFETGNVNEASLPAFWLGIQGDIDDALIKCEKYKKEVIGK